MLTFTQYLEGMKAFNTRDASYELPLAADMSSDSNDANDFLAPLTRRIKAFGHYLSVAAQDINQPGGPRFPSGSSVSKRRVNFLHSMVGDHHHDGLTFSEFTSLLSRAAQLCREFVYHTSLKIQYGTKGSIWTTYLEQISKVLKRIIDWEYTNPTNDPVHAHWANEYQQNQQLIDKIKDKAKRMRVFVREAMKHTPKMDDLNFSPRQVVPYDGRT